LKKAFGRIEFQSLFEALQQQQQQQQQQQHVPKFYGALLWNLYRNQKGYISGGDVFEIERGVPQSDHNQPSSFQRRPGTRTTEMETKMKRPLTSNWCR